LEPSTACFTSTSTSTYAANLPPLAKPESFPSLRRPVSGASQHHSITAYPYLQRREEPWKSGVNALLRLRKSGCDWIIGIGGKAKQGSKQELCTLKSEGCREERCAVLLLLGD
jgi:hypothetical protein